MREVYGDFWDYPADVKLITTNGFVKNNGEAVMGRGVAYQATIKCPGVARHIGAIIAQYGNHTRLLAVQGILSSPDFLQGIGFGIFPTKHHWREKSDINLIKQSAEELRDIARSAPKKVFLLPAPGTSNGRLSYYDVRKVIAGILPDNVIVISNDMEVAQYMEQVNAA